MRPGRSGDDAPKEYPRMNAAEDEFAYLDEPPEGPLAPPPVQTAAQMLPFHELRWRNFERLCRRLVREESEEGDDVRFYGTAGQKQGGIDIVRRRSGGQFVTYQCKQLER